MGQARVHRDVGQTASMGGEASVAVKRTELREQGTGLRQGAGGRRIEPGQLAGLDRTPFGEVEG
ncbi:MAG: hypothetical protein UZ03_NOB001003647 [Nitrospira sp. OLB3]|nr:MAG: hypothetical protein UZ03_NOB001003647 [Nitrospira sp. OLB3]